MTTEARIIILLMSFCLTMTRGKSQDLKINHFAGLLMVDEQVALESELRFGACVLGSGSFAEIQRKIHRIKSQNPSCLVFFDGQIDEFPDPDLAFQIQIRTQRRQFLNELSSMMDSIGIDFIIRKNTALDNSCRSQIRQEQIEIFGQKGIRLIKWSDQKTGAEYFGTITSINPGGLTFNSDLKYASSLSIGYLPAYRKMNEKTLLRCLKLYNFIFVQKPDLVLEALYKFQPFSIEAIANKTQVNEFSTKKNRAKVANLLREISPEKITEYARSAHVVLDSSRLPFLLSRTRNISIIQIGNTDLSQLRTHLNFYAPTSVRQFSDDLTGIKSHLYKAKDNQLIIIVEKELYRTFDAQLISVITHLQKENKAVILVSHENQNISAVFDTDILTFDLSYSSQKVLAEVLFGAVAVKNTLPYDFGELMCGHGHLLPEQNLLRFSSPEEVGISTTVLKKIEEIVYEAIDQKATPGCQILIAKNKKIIWEKAYGYQDYKSNRKVEPHHLYDLASLTKILSTTQLLMSNWERASFPLDARIGELLPELSGEIADVAIRDLLTHRSGLQPFMPIFDLMSEEDLNTRFHELYCDHEDDDYCVEVAEDLFLRKDLVDSIWLNITKLDPKRKRYRYSDVNFNLLKRLIERQNGEDLYTTLLHRLITPLNLQSLCFRPADCFPLELIVPTQEDQTWRNQLLHGYVHDYATALMGGVSGSAGLFSNTRDLAIIAQMWLNNGSYGDQNLLKESTIKLFTSTQTYSHRGLGFNKPHPNGRSSGIAESASLSTYGHTGFTGTCMWIDPKEDLIFIFLSNRVHPDESNNLLQKLKIRERIHEQVYQSLNSYKIN